MSQCIRQIVKLALIKKFLGHVVLQPQDLGDLHLNGHLPANIAEEVVVSGIDQVGFLDGTVIQPQNDIAVSVEVGAGHGDGLVGVGREYGQGAGGIEANTPHEFGVDVVLADGTLDGDADTTPDIGGRLFLYTLVSNRRIEVYRESLVASHT